MDKEEKCIAEFTTWGGRKIRCKIKKSWAEGIITAVKGQCLFIDNQAKFTVNGKAFKNVDIYGN